MGNAQRSWGGRSFQRAKRWVVKLGSSTLVRGPDPDREFMDRLAEDIVSVKKDDREVVLVTSGAIAAGRAQLGIEERPRSVTKKQAIAAVGQIALMSAYRAAFAGHEQPVAQLLLTHDDFRYRKRFLNARHTLTTLLEMGVVPLINENDSVAVEEIVVGDNDNLSAMVACLLQADVLVLLSDIDGLYTADPQVDAEATFIAMVENVEEMEAFAADRAGEWGTGGMQTKLEAARRTASYGIPTVIALGREARILTRLKRGEAIGTLVLPGRRQLRGRKHWLAHTLRPEGTLYVDDGARRAIFDRGKSLLPSGVTRVEGQFTIGDLVRVSDQDGRVFAQGLAAYSASEVVRIKGCKSGEIETRLGYKYCDEIIHRDDLVLL